MANNKTKLIIWDFDGVISDTEHLWIKNWMTLLNQKFGLSWNFEIANFYLGGISHQTKIENLSRLGINIDDDFLQKLKMLDWKMMKNIEPVKGVENIFKLEQFCHCIATGGNRDKTERKLEILDFGKYFPDNHIFTAQQVQNGKPAPDLFLFAAEQMGYSASDSIVVEDSLAGLNAGLSAGMITLAFLGCPMNNTSEYFEKVKQLGIKKIFTEMSDIQRFLVELSFQ